MSAIPSELNELLKKANNLHTMGKLEEAKKVLDLVLSKNPKNIDALHSLGVIAYNKREMETASKFFQEIIEISPNQVSYNYLGIILRATGNLSQAIVNFNLALKINPNYSEAYFNLGNSYRECSELNLALNNYDKAIALNNNFHEAFNNKGDTLEKLSHFADAIQCYDEAISLNPFFAAAYCNRGNAYFKLNKIHESISDYKKAISIDPNLYIAYSNLGNSQRILKEYGNAIINCDTGIKLNPNFADAYLHKANILCEQRKFDEAIFYYDQAIEKNPESRDAYCNRGIVLQLTGRYVDALNSVKKSLEIDGNSAISLQNYSSILAFMSEYSEVIKHSNSAISHATELEYQGVWAARLYTLIYHPDLDAKAICSEHVKWGEKYSAYKGKDFSDRNRSANRKLKIGYVSPDFRGHTCRFYYEPLFSNHDHERFELFAYSSSLQQDEHTERLKNYFDKWRNIYTLSDLDAANLIFDDQIDILVDGCGHMMDSRLLVFAHKPAPIQVTWLGSAWTTGLKQIDYALFDPFMAPEGTVASEQIIRLPKTWAAFRPSEKAFITKVAKSPANINGVVTYGYSGRSERLNHKVFKAWGKILESVPKGRILLDYKIFSDLNTQIYYKNYMQSLGVDTTRIIMRNSSDIFLGLGDIDIILDSFPHSGGTMLYDALWMGVPAITIAGDRPVGRIGTTLMTNLGLTDWIAKDEDEYVNKAIHFGNNLPLLEKLREEIRNLMQNSPVMDEKGFAENVEDAFRFMWSSFISTSKL